MELDLNEVKELSLNYFEDNDKQIKFEKWFDAIQKYGVDHFVEIIAESLANKFDAYEELKSNVGV